MIERKIYESTTTMIPVILSGGSGTRLWPMSRQFTPKQFLSLSGENTLFQATVERTKKFNLDDPMVVCLDGHGYVISNNLKDIGQRAKNIILQPAQRSTAPAIAAAAFRAMQLENDPIILVLPVDHVFENDAALATAFKAAEKLAEKGLLVTFGVKPTEPHTGYGYIKVGQQIGICSNQIDCFIEKPNKEKAEALLEEQGYLWNSGMFCFKASAYLNELKIFYPDMYKQVQKSVDNAERDCEFTSLEQESFEKSHNISVDYAVMEKTDKGCVVEIDAQWNDIGSWDAVCDISEKDENNNIAIGDTLEEDSFNNFIYSKDKLLVTLGVDNLTIINTPDAILVASKYHSNEVKTVVDRLNAMERPETKYHAKSDTPWGTSNTLHSGSMSEVKRLSVKPGAQVQSIDHAFQSEHWIILKGQARASSSSRSEILSRDDSIHVEEGAIYTFENIGSGDLEIIQIKTGDGVEESNVMKING